MKTFQTVLGDVAMGAVGLVELPFDPKVEFGRARAPVRGTINGHPFRTTVAIYGGRAYLGFRKEVRAAAKVSPGDRVKIALELDDTPRDVDVPRDLARALTAAPAAKKLWPSLSFTRRKELVVAIESAKKPETRARRVEKAVADLTAEAARRVEKSARAVKRSR